MEKYNYIVGLLCGSAIVFGAVMTQIYEPWTFEAGMVGGLFGLCYGIACELHDRKKEKESQ